MTSPGATTVYLQDEDQNPEIASLQIQAVKMIQKVNDFLLNLYL